MTPEREAEIRAVLNGDLSADIDTIPLVVARMADDLLDEVDRLRAIEAGVELQIQEALREWQEGGDTDGLARAMHWRTLLNPTEGEDQ